MSRIDRERQPDTDETLPISAGGPLGMRPYVAFSPGRPQNAAGMRIDPPPSPPVAIGTRPPATAAALPPEEPPGFFDSSHGLRLAPFSRVYVTLMPPNSLAVVRPHSTPPASRRRATIVASCDATRSANTRHASVSGHPRTAVSSFTPIGTPPNGSDTSAAS